MPSGEAAPRTVRQRSQSLANVRLAVTAGDTTAQLSHELHSVEREDREKLLEEIKKTGKFLIRVPVQVSLAMKADMGIPWNQIRLLRRWETKLISVTNYCNLYQVVEHVGGVDSK